MLIIQLRILLDFISTVLSYHFQEEDPLVHYSLLFTIAKTCNIMMAILVEPQVLFNFSNTDFLFARFQMKLVFQALINHFKDNFTSFTYLLLQVQYLKASLVPFIFQNQNLFHSVLILQLLEEDQHSSKDTLQKLHSIRLKCCSFTLLKVDTAKDCILIRLTMFI